MPHVYTTGQWLPRPTPQVFAFFANPHNLPRLMPAWQKARIESLALVPPPGAPPGSSAEIAAGAGTRVILSFRPLPLVPIRLTWDAEIADFVWNQRFCDIQLQRGPFAHWRHCHSVQPETRDGVVGTLLTDRVEYTLPFEPLSNIAHALAIRRQIRATFAFRQRRTAELLAPGA